MIKNEKLLEIDILRAISVLAVITIHTTAYFTQISSDNSLQIVMAYIDNISSFAVPSFVFISGLVLYKNYNFLQEKLSIFYKKRFFKILPIYLLFSIFYLIITEISNLLHAREVHFNFIKIVYNLCTGGTFYHLWYFGILFQFYLFYPLLSRLYKKYKINFLIIIFFIQLVWSFVGEDIINFIWYKFGEEKHPFPFLLGYIFWFVFGFYFSENKEKIIRIINIKIGIVLIIFLNILRTVPFYYGLQRFNYETIPEYYFNITAIIDPFFFLLEILFFYKVSIQILNKTNKITNAFIKIGNYSLEIYLIHAIFIIVLVNLLKFIKIDQEKLLFYPILWIGTLFISYLFVLIYKKYIKLNKI